MISRPKRLAACSAHSAQHPTPWRPLGQQGQARGQPSACAFLVDFFEYFAAFERHALSYFKKYSRHIENDQAGVGPVCVPKL